MSKRDREYKRGDSKKDKCRHVDIKVTTHTVKGVTKDIEITWYRCNDCGATWNEAK